MVQREIDLLEVRMVGAVAISAHWIHWTVSLRAPFLLKLFQIRQHIKRLRQLIVRGRAWLWGWQGTRFARSYRTDLWGEMGWALAAGGARAISAWEVIEGYDCFGQGS